MNSMVLIAIIAATFVGTYGAPCPPFDPDASCPDAHAGFLADPCNATCWYTCERVGPSYTAVLRCCQPCEVWSQDLLTCVPDVLQPDCAYEPSTPTVGECTLAEGSNKYTFILGNVEMTCAPGTVFSLAQCACIMDPSPHPPPVEVKELTCITFSNGWNNLAGTRGVWVKSSNVKVISGCTTAGGNCGFFDSSLSSMMSIPLFANAYDSYSELSISLWFKRTAGVSGKQGLVGNGDCGASSSIGLMSEDENLVSVLMKNSANVDFTATGLTAPDGDFHHLAVVYDGASIMVYIDGTSVSSGAFSGKIKKVYFPMIIGGCLCGTCYFNGYMDTISFAKTAFSPADVSSLFSDQSLCMPAATPPI